GIEQRLGASERVLRRGEALRYHVRHVVVDDVLLGVHHVGEALYPEGLRGWCGDEQDVRARRHRVCRLDVERDLERPRRLVLLTCGPVARNRLGGGRTLEVELAESRHARRARDAFLTAYRRDSERLVEDVQ